jgi:FAD/FMN-containing dehydrogenase
MTLVNDIHSQLNRSEVHDVVEVDSVEAVQAAVLRARDEGLSIAIAGGRHAMGGQQFCAGGLLIDTRGLDRVQAHDGERGTITVESGIQWPALLEQLTPTRWAIAQKQTGADRLSVGGAIAVSAHGRGLTMAPLGADVEQLTLVDAEGEVRNCSRHENAELFSLVIGGYGLFGVVTSATLRLTPRRTLERVVEVRDLGGIAEAFDERIAAGYTYGDFQFAIDPETGDFLHRGVFSCYRPVDDATPIPDGQKALSREEWAQLLLLTHTDKAEAFARYSDHYLKTSGQLYFSDAHQYGDYVDGYHARLDVVMNAAHPATEMITEIYVPRDRLTDFMAAVAADFREDDVDVIYGTVRLIERDQVSFLAWAREPWACVIFNLHTVHTPAGLEHSSRAFCRLIDYAIERGGSYFLTYHRWATTAQLEACYPQFRAFLELKRTYDPEERFQSDWYRHYRDALA